MFLFTNTARYGNIKKRGDIINFNIINILISIPGVVIAVTLHEYVKSLVAYKLGDENVKKQGRLSISPLKHMDILGAIFLLVFRFGWAKPLRVTPFSFKNQKQSRKQAMILLFAIPFLTNFIIGAVFAIAANIFYMHFVTLLDIFSLEILLMIEGILFFIAFYNISFALFNIIPIYPMDGIMLLGAIKPMWAMKISQYEKILQLVLAFFIIFGFAHIVFGNFVTNIIEALSF